MSKAFEKLMLGLKEVEAYMAGEREGYRVHVPEAVDVKKIRSGLQMTQASFSDCFGFSLDAVKHWEGGRRQPEVSARAYLTVIAKEPGAVMRALGREQKPRKRVQAKAA
jgi:putative transcriptional regulator